MIFSFMMTLTSANSSSLSEKLKSDSKISYVKSAKS